MTVGREDNNDDDDTTTTTTTNYIRSVCVFVNRLVKEKERRKKERKKELSIYVEHRLARSFIFSHRYENSNSNNFETNLFALFSSIATRS